VVVEIEILQAVGTKFFDDKMPVLQRLKLFHERFDGAYDAGVAADYFPQDFIF